MVCASLRGKVDVSVKPQAAMLLRSKSSLDSGALTGLGPGTADAVINGVGEGSGKVEVVAGEAVGSSLIIQICRVRTAKVRITKMGQQDNFILPPN